MENYAKPNNQSLRIPLEHSKGISFMLKTIV